MYIGNGRMIEAYDAATPVRVTPVRFGTDYWARSATSRPTPGDRLAVREGGAGAHDRRSSRWHSYGA
ncbi:MAG: hypothetical protein ACRDRL_32495 [Sciscionella sp.]